MKMNFIKNKCQKEKKEQGKKKTKTNFTDMDKQIFKMLFLTSEQDIRDRKNLLNKLDRLKRLPSGSYKTWNKLESKVVKCTDEELLEFIKESLKGLSEKDKINYNNM